MDLSLGLITLLGMVGYNMNSNIQQRDFTEKRKQISDSEIPNGDNIYNSEEYLKIVNAERSASSNAFDKRIKDLNSYAIIVNRVDAKSPVVKAEKSYPSIEKAEAVAESDKYYNGPMFNNERGYTKEIILENFTVGEEDKNKSKLSGQPTDFSHQNMTPYFGGSIKATRDSQSTLNNYTAAYKNPKNEPVAGVVNGKQNIHGMANYTTLVDSSRFDTSKYKSNTLPFEQYKESYIPQEQIRVNERNIDELRTLSNQKMGGVEARMNLGAGDYKRTTNPTFSKNQPNTAYTIDTSDYYPTSVKGTLSARNYNSVSGNISTIKADVVESELEIGGSYSKGLGNRITMSNIDDKSISTYHQESRRKLVKPVEHFRNIGSAVSGVKSDPLKGYNLPEQERETSNRERFGISGGYTKSPMADGYKAKTTNKELNSYEYIGAGGAQVPSMKAGVEFYQDKKFGKTKPSMAYTAGGLDKNSIKRFDLNTSAKNRPEINDYNGIAKKISNNNPRADIGKMSGKKFKTTEKDFSYRIN